MSYLNWHVGMKVVFVNSGGVVNLVRSGWRKWLPRQRLSHNLQTGETYTISGIVTHLDEDRGDIVCIFLVGFAFKESAKVAFPAGWFRPVETRKTDISLFEGMLTGTKQTECA